MNKTEEPSKMVQKALRKFSTQTHHWKHFSSLTAGLKALMLTSKHFPFLYSIDSLSLSEWRVLGYDPTSGSHFTRISLTSWTALNVTFQFIQVHSIQSNPSPVMSRALSRCPNIILNLPPPPKWVWWHGFTGRWCFHLPPLTSLVLQVYARALVQTPQWCASWLSNTWPTTVVLSDECIVIEIQKD